MGGKATMIERTALNMKKNILGKPLKLAFAGAVIVAILLFPIFSSRITLHFAMVGLTGAILALGLNIFYGYCGQINFGSAGFFAIGGYGVALLDKYIQMPYFVSLFLSIVISGIIAFLMSRPLLRLREYMLALGTLAFGMAIYEAVSKGFTSYTGGEDGINISKLKIFGTPAGDTFFFYLFLIAILLCYWVSYALRNSRTGRAMVSISQDETAATSLGVNINNYLIQAFMLSGMILTLAGGLFVKWTGWCSPEYFSLKNSILILLAVVVGGVGSAFGAIIGGLIMFILQELLVPLAIYEMLAYGIILCIFLLFMPKGIKSGIISIANWFKGANRR
jgi:branched-chain amino acid transport system permease protein